MPHVTLVPHVIRTGAPYNVDPVSVPTLLGHANVETTAHDDHPGEGAKKKAAGTVHVP